jgi:hypothetical protein
LLGGAKMRWQLVLVLVICWLSPALLVQAGQETSDRQAKVGTEPCPSIMTRVAEKDSDTGVREAAAGVLAKFSSR